VRRHRTAQRPDSRRWTIGDGGAARRRRGARIVDVAHGCATLPDLFCSRPFANCHLLLSASTSYPSLLSSTPPALSCFSITSPSPLFTHPTAPSPPTYPPPPHLPPCSSPTSLPIPYPAPPPPQKPPPLSLLFHFFFFLFVLCVRARRRRSPRSQSKQAIAVRTTTRRIRGREWWCATWARRWPSSVADYPYRGGRRAKRASRVKWEARAGAQSQNRSRGAPTPTPEGVCGGAPRVFDDCARQTWARPAKASAGTSARRETVARWHSAERRGRRGLGGRRRSTSESVGRRLKIFSKKAARGPVSCRIFQRRRTGGYSTRLGVVLTGPPTPCGGRGRPPEPFGLRPKSRNVAA